MPRKPKAKARRASARKPGRPTKYSAAFTRQAAAMCRLGATDVQLAEAFDVSVDSITRWKQRHPEFCGALKLGKDEADDRVERSLFERANGYSHPDTHVSVHDGKVKLTALTKHYPPDTTAGIFWLKNRRPKEWRDRQELTGAGGAPLVPDSQISLDDAARRIVFLLTCAEEPKPAAPTG